jgi:magnesium chelatase accessory protein
MVDSTGAPEWDVEGRDWPGRAASRFVGAGGIRWHVQESGRGPPIVLLHGTGASTHSWRGLAPLLEPHFAVTSLDLPGHGFTEPPAGALTLPAMSQMIRELLAELGIEPVIGIGHSAGAAILARMALDGSIAPHGLISLNGALLPFRGIARHLFPPLARLLFVNPLTVRMTAWRGADRNAVARLLAGTGSRIEPEGVELYARLFSAPRHVRATFGMMANWDLEPLVRGLPRLPAALALIAAGDDRAVPPEQAAEVRARVPGAEVVYLRNLGHLAHEENPRLLAETILAIARKWGVIAQPP